MEDLLHALYFSSNERNSSKSCERMTKNRAIRKLQEQSTRRGGLRNAVNEAQPEFEASQSHKLNKTCLFLLVRDARDSNIGSLHLTC